MSSPHIELFETLATQPDNPEPTTGLLVVSTPRSGSTLFCDVLTNDGQVGIVDEWFNEKHFAAWQEVMNYDTFSLPEYLDFVTRKTAPKGCFSLHVHIGQLLHISKEYEFAVGDMGFDHMVWIYREDKVQQAVSLAKAVSTNQWKSTHEAKGEPDLSFENIAMRLATIIDQDQFYRRVLGVHTDDAFAYEDFRSLPCGSTSPWNKTLHALGLNPLASPPVPSTERQRDFKSREAAREFRNYLSGV